MSRTDAWPALKSALRGALLTPAHSEYDGARKVFNAMIDKRPAAIARCTGAADVITCVNFAREHDLSVSVRGGGHGVAGKAVSEGGLMIDLSEMKGIRVDAARRTAHAQPGLRLGEFDRETQAFGLATTLGMISNIKWTRELWEAMQPFVEQTVYVNNLGEEGDERVRAAYGPNYDRLVSLKNKYDPTNFFRANQNIKPAS